MPPWDLRTANYGSKIVPTYVAGVDKPGDVSEGSELPVHVAANFTVFPAVVDVDKSHHVPLKRQKKNVATISTHSHAMFQDSAPPPQVKTPPT